MNKQLIGTVNQYGKEALEGCYAKDRIVFEPKDAIKRRDGKFLKYVTWSAWLIDVTDHGPKSEADYKSGRYESRLTGYAGD